jgi:hypothetical protein
LSDFVKKSGPFISANLEGIKMDSTISSDFNYLLEYLIKENSNFEGSILLKKTIPSFL